ncbi:MAG: delta-60 repeat domain-containing protein [Flavobacteriales bacterium]|nr:delta-60 repeat domain-containing protein [Flavobacteriales bacterium]
MLVGGQFHTFNGSASPFIVRLNADGSLDPTFDANPGYPSFSTVFDIAVQPDGKILAVGSFDTFDGLSRKDIVRLKKEMERWMPPSIRARAPMATWADRLLAHPC